MKFLKEKIDNIQKNLKNITEKNYLLSPEKNHLKNQVRTNLLDLLSLLK